MLLKMNHQKSHYSSHNWAIIKIIINTSYSHLDKPSSTSPVECTHHTPQSLQRNLQYQDELPIVVNRHIVHIYTI